MSDELKTLIRGALRSRLFLLGIGLLVAALIQIGMARYGHYLSPDLQTLILGFAGVLVSALRADTSTSLRDKGEANPPAT